MRPRILIADDETDILDMLTLNLSSAGFQVLRCEDGTSVISVVNHEFPDLLILDLMMPGMTGMEVCKGLKSEPRTALIPVILLTAVKTEVDRILAFELGVDDYVTKPFSPRELILRIKAILRRREANQATADRFRKVGQITVDFDRHYVAVGTDEVQLSAIEFKLLTALLEREGRVQTRESLLCEVWGMEADIEPRTVDTHLRRLREKLGSSGDQIHTVRGVGYRLDQE